MKTEQIIKSLEETQSKMTHYEAVLKLNKANEQQFEITEEDIMNIIDNKTPFKFISPVHKSGFHSAPWIGLKNNV